MRCSWRRAGQPGPLTRLLSCGPEALQGYRATDAVPTWPVPNYRSNLALGNEYGLYNRPAALLHWLQARQPALSLYCTAPLHTPLLCTGACTSLCSTAAAECNPGQMWTVFPACPGRVTGLCEHSAGCSAPRAVHTCPARGHAFPPRCDARAAWCPAWCALAWRQLLPNALRDALFQFTAQWLRTYCIGAQRNALVALKA